MGSWRRFGGPFALFALVLSGCSLDSNGGGDDDTDTETDSGSGTESDPTSPTGPTAGATTPGMTTQTTMDPSTTDATATDSSSGSGTDADTTGSDSGSETTDPTAENCRPFQDFIWTADLPDEASTFNESDANSLPELDGEPVPFLWGQNAGEGFTTIAFETPCEDDVFLWVLGWDAEGNDPDNSDSFHFGLDQEEVTTDSAIWEYGCDNSFRGRGWQWYRVRETADDCGDDPAGPYALDAGEHTFTVVPREGASFQPIDFNFSGLAAFVATNDPDYDPADDYDPTPPE